jgi:iodotyrosine deiodinase
LDYRENFIEISAYPRLENPVQKSVEFFELMSSRRSVRRFSPEPVEREVLLNAIRAAGTAPNGANRQPWFFALIESFEIRERIRRDAEKVETLFYAERASKQCLADLKPLGTGPDKHYLSVAPALIAVFTRHGQGIDVDTGKTYYPLESTGIAVGLLITALHTVGLASLTHTPRPMNFLNDILNLDRSYRPFVLVVTGFPASPIVVPDISRKPLNKICRVY